MIPPHTHAAQPFATVTPRQAARRARRPPDLPRLLVRVLSYVQRQVAAFDVERQKRAMRHCGRDVQISSQCFIWGLEGFAIGDGSAIHQFTHVFASGGVQIGAGVMISANVSISSVTHPVCAANRTDAPLEYAPVTIHDNVWIGMGAVILPGVTIGANAVVGAGAVVTRDVPPATVVAGNPARTVRTIDGL